MICVAVILVVGLVLYVLFLLGFNTPELCSD